MPCSTGSAARLVAVLAVVLATLSLAGAGQASPREVSVDVHARGHYPDVLPVPPGDGLTPGKPEAQRSSAEPERRVSRSPGSGGPWASTSSGALDAPGVLLLVLAIAALVVMFGWMLLKREPAPPEPDAGVAPPNAEPEAPADPGDPDVLAAAGRVDAAIRAVLIRALESVGWSPDEAGAKTAREVLRGLAGSDPRREPLGGIVRDAEAVRFAGAGATRERFTRMRALLDRVRSARGAA